MAINLTTDASLNFDMLQKTIKNEELNVYVRLASLKGLEESGVNFNAHVYESVDDDTQPFSKLFTIKNGGMAANDPEVKKWLAQNPTQKIKCEEMVYIEGALKKVAVVR